MFILSTTFLVLSANVPNRLLFFKISFSKHTNQYFHPHIPGGKPTCRITKAQQKHWMLTNLHFPPRLELLSAHTPIDVNTRHTCQVGGSSSKSVTLRFVTNIA